MEPLVTLTRVTRNGQVTLPASVRRALHVEQGDYLEVRVEDDRVVLTPKKLVDQSQAYFWTQSWQAAEREASEDLSAGRVREAPTVEDLIEALEEGRKGG